MLLSFSANNIPPSILEATLVGRKEIVDQIENELLEKVLKGRSYQSLLIAPRGSGKTHITSVLYHRIKSNIELLDKVYVAYMIEDERGIANFLDFIRHILESFVRHKEGNYHSLMESIYEISDLDDSKQEDAIVELFLNFLGDKKLVLLIENLNVIFNNKTGMGVEGQKKFRSLIHETNCINILATSQSLFRHIEDSDAPFYNFFNIRNLEKLTFEQTLEFIGTLIDLELESNPNSEANKKLKQEINKPTFSGKVKAIYELTGGNYRLLVIFFDFLKAEVKSDLTRIFEKAMNDLKPYYEQFLNALSPQQQKVIKYLCREHRPKLGKEISRFCFIKANNLSKVTSDLVQDGFLETHSVGKDSYYELKEPLMRICFEITEHQSGIVKLFVNFLSLLYSAKTIESKALELIKNSFSKVLVPVEISKNKEVQMYIQALPPKRRVKLDSILNCTDSQTLFTELEKFNKENEIKDDKVMSQQTIGANDKLIKPRIKEKNFSSKILSFSFLPEDYIKHLTNEFENFSEANIESIFNTLSTIEDLFKRKKIKFNPKNNILERDGIDHLLGIDVFSKDENLCLDLVILLSFIKKYELSLKVLDAVFDDTTEIAKVYSYKGYNFFYVEEYDKSIKATKQAIKLDPKNSTYHLNLGLILAKTGKNEDAIYAFKTANKLDKDNYKICVNLAYASSGLNNFEDARDFYLKAIELNNQEDDYLCHELAKTYKKLGNSKKAAEYLLKAIEINKRLLYFLDLGELYHDEKKYKKSITNFSNAIKIFPNYASLYFYRAFSNFESGNVENAIVDIEKAAEIDPNSPAYYWILGTLYKDKEKSIRALKKATHLDPENVKYRFEYIDALYELENYDEAITELKTVLELEPESIKALGTLGKVYFILKEYELSLNCYHEIIGLDPKNSNAYYMRGSILDIMGEKTQAIKAYKIAIDLDPENDNYHFQLALSYCDSKNYSEGIISFEKAYELNPKNLSIKLNLGYAYYKHQNYEKAEDLYLELINQDPKFLEVYSKLSELYIIQKEYVKSIQIVKDAIEFDTNNAEFYFLLGISFFGLKKHKEALIEFNKAYELSPKNRNTLINLGKLHQINKDYRLAEEKYNEALKLRPNDMELYKLLSEVLIAQGRNDEIVNLYKKLIQENPNNLEALFELGNSLIDMGKLDDALLILEKANRLKPDNLSVLYNLGFVHLLLDNNNSAIEIFTKAINIQPNRSEFYFRLGQAYNQEKKYEKAIEYYSKAVDLNSEISEYYYNLALNLSIIEKYDEAKINYEKAIKLESGIPEYYFIYGVNFIGLKEYKRALIQFKKAVKANPKNEKYLDQLAETYSKLDDYSNAIKFYRKLIKLNPNNYEYYLDLASCYSKLKNFNKAIDSTKEAMKLNLKNSNIYNSLGILYLKNGNVSGARREFENGLVLDNNNWHLNGSLTSALIAENLFDEAKKQYETVYDLTDFEKNAFELFVFEDNLRPLFKFSNKKRILDYLIFIKEDLISKNLTFKLWLSLSLTIFDLLVNIEDYATERIEMIHEVIKQVFEDNKESKIPLLYLDIGSKHLINNDERALYDFSKEERKVFKDFVLEKRKLFIKN
jgi:tetratricopeptide (TPR) repeat protein